MPLPAVGTLVPVRINRRLYALARASGLTQAEAVRFAGGKPGSQAAASRTANRLERLDKVQAYYRAFLAEREAQASMALRATWQDVTTWMRKVAAGEVEATNLDRLGVAQIVGRALGKFQSTIVHEHVRSQPRVSHLGEFVIDADGTRRLAPGERAALEAAAGVEAPKVEAPAADAKPLSLYDSIPCDP